VPALFELLDVRGDEGDEEEEEEKDVKFSRKCSRGGFSNGGRLLFSGGSGARHARRCAYALLSSRGMLKAAVVGLDADVADVDAVEEAAANAAEEDEEAGAEAEAAAAAGDAAAADENGRRVGVPRRRGKSGDSRRPRRRARAREERRRPKQQLPGKSLVERARERAHSREGGSVGSSRTSAAVLRGGFPPEGRLFPP
jgi:hypothetical protein